MCRVAGPQICAGGSRGGEGSRRGCLVLQGKSQRTVTANVLDGLAAGHPADIAQLGKRLPDGPCQLCKWPKFYLGTPPYQPRDAKQTILLSLMQCYMYAAYASLLVWAWTACKTCKAPQLATDARAHAQASEQT